MKKVIVLFVAIVLTCTLTGCFGDEYPRITLHRDIWRFTENEIYVNGYILDEENPYNRIQTKDGVDIVIHFKEAQK